MTNSGNSFDPVGNLDSLLAGLASHHDPQGIVAFGERVAAGLCAKSSAELLDMTIEDVETGNAIVDSLEEARCSLVARLELVMDAQRRVMWWAKVPDVPTGDIRDAAEDAAPVVGSLKSGQTRSVTEEYLARKAENPTMLLLCKMGDFYEGFFDDAVTISNGLGIGLTKRGRHSGNEIPMCGIPISRANEYFARLTKAGFQIGVCKQNDSGGWDVFPWAGDRSH